MISREQVADLQPGDVVAITDGRWPEGSRVQGPLASDGHGALTLCGGVTIRYADGGAGQTSRDLTVVSRVPRLYVNHPRTEPVPGDVVRDADDDSDCRTWSFAVGGLGNPGWRFTGGGTSWWRRDALPARLRLLVDGETGMPPAGSR